MTPTVWSARKSQVANPPRRNQATISHAIGSIFESANSIQKWTPARGHAFVNPTKEATPVPNGSGGRAGQPSAVAKKSSNKQEDLDTRLAEESFAIHTAFGGDYMDEIPITGKPGEFHFASTGRKDKPSTAQPQLQAPTPAVTVKPPLLTPLNTARAADIASPKELKKTKSPKPGSARTKDRRKSKAGTTTGTPTPI